MTYADFASLAQHPDFRAAAKAGRVKAAAKLPPLLSLPFAGKPEKVFARQVAAFADRLASFPTSKGTIRLPLDQPMPLDLIADIAQALEAV